MAKTKTETMELDARSMAGKELLTHPLGELSVEEIHFGWSLLDLFEKAAKKRKDDMRDLMLEVAEKHGEADDRGSMIFGLGDGEIKKEKRQGASKVKEAAVRKLLVAKGIDPDRIFVKKTVVQFDADAFKEIVSEGLIEEDEIDALYTPGKVTWALKVKKPGALPKSLLPGKG